jgi:GDP-L-galactose phosphorylase
VNDCKKRVCILLQMLPGEYGFIAQLNEGRHLKKRPTEFRVDQVLQPFDPKKFNFTKIGQEEILFQFGPSEDGVSEYYEKAPVLSSPNVVAINVSFLSSEVLPVS